MIAQCPFPRHNIGKPAITPLPHSAPPHTKTRASPRLPATNCRHTPDPTIKKPWNQTEEKKKCMIPGNLFSFSNFPTFWKFRYIGTSLKELFPINYQQFRSYGTFKILTRSKIDLKDAVTMLSHQGYSLTCIWLHKIYRPKVRGSWVIRALKSPILRDKHMVLFVKCL